MPTYRLNLDTVHREILTGHTRLGGENHLGESYGVTSYYLTHNGNPFFGVSGEFQFSRYPETGWEEELLKIKASGVNMIATYLFWIHHEEQPGIFDWSGNKNLRRFVQLCARHSLPVIARIGPFAHGECRNGGLPDWLYGMPFQVRSNDPAYLDRVRRYYREIANQLRGLLFKEGGPVVCIQLDNEYEHTGAPWDAADRSAPLEWLPRGNGGVEHMRHLKRIAEEQGLVTPLYTVTGWGSPVLEDETLPVHGGYAYPVWVENPQPSDLYLFFDRQVAPHPDAHYRLPYYYPLINAEMQGGIQVRYNNRPVIPPHSTEALTLVQMGSGCNFIGYYIYHGGSNPWSLTGYANEVLHPQVSYDFQAPIGEYGQVRDACRYVKTLHMFLAAFGEKLTPMLPVFPDGSKEIAPSDTHTLRYAARVKDGAAFLFLNNFQDHIDTQPIPGIRFELTLNGETIRLPKEEELTLQPDVCCLLPLNLDLHGARLVYATAQPLSQLETAQETHYFFYAPQGISPEYCFAEETLTGLSGATGAVQRADGRLYLTPPTGWQHSFTFTTLSGKSIRVTTLARAEAEHAWGQERLVISSADPLFIDGGLELRAQNQSEFDLVVFPPVEQDLQARGGTLAAEPTDEASRFHLTVQPWRQPVQPQLRGADKLLLEFPASLLDGVSDVFLTVDYTGDIAGAYINGQLVADHYNNGAPWQIGLKRFFPAILEHGLLLRFRPLRKGQVKNVSNAMAARMDFEGEERLEIHAVRLTPEYTLRVD